MISKSVETSPPTHTHAHEWHDQEECPKPWQLKVLKNARAKKNNNKIIFKKNRKEKKMLGTMVPPKHVKC